MHIEFKCVLYYFPKMIVIRNRSPCCLHVLSNIVLINYNSVVMSVQSHVIINYNSVVMSLQSHVIINYNSVVMSLQSQVIINYNSVVMSLQSHVSAWFPSSVTMALLSRPAKCAHLF